MLLLPHAVAQHGGGGHGMGGGMPGGFGGGGFGHRMGEPPPVNNPDRTGTVGPMRGGLQLGPPGRWWDDKGFAKQLKLRPDQQRRMDTIFEANRSVLIKRFLDLETEENKMAALVQSKTLDEPSLFAQIDRIAQARAELEKANTRLLLQLRAEMDPDQINRLEQHR